MKNEERKVKNVLLPISMSNKGSKPLQEKSYAFALDVVRICRKIMEERKEFVLSKQFLRSGTSIGANIEESQFAQSKADFISKLSIALKEANESRYWIRLLADSGFLSSMEAIQIAAIADDIVHILIRSLKTAKALS